MHKRSPTVLRDIGFVSVDIVVDASRQEMIRALQAFQERVATADWAVVYFAGHGLEVGGVNYLIPVDAQLTVDTNVQDEAVTLDRVLDAIKGSTKISVVIVDACRDNPFQRTMRRSLATRSIGRGLSAVEPDTATLVAFAAKAGEVAEDGTGNNSPFASALVRRLREPGIEINKMFRLVRDDVMDATNKRQQPFTYGSLPGREDFFFVQSK